MTRLRQLGLVAAIACLGLSASAQDINDTFNEGVDLLQRGRRDEALAKFQAVLAMDPSNDAAYELWKSTEHEIWIQLLLEGGDFQLIAQRLGQLSKLARAERANDADAIKELVGQLCAESDAIQRRRIIRDLSANHGEFAVPYLLRALADPNDDDCRVITMHALTEMGTDVVPPLVEALATEDLLQRRNVVLTLGYIADPRAAGVLAALAVTDADDGVKTAATQSASRCGSNGNALESFLRDGDDYHHKRATVLRPHDYSSVVWEWDGGLVPHTVPQVIYNDEMAKKCYYGALAISPESLEARAGIARANVDLEAKLRALAQAGVDVEDLVAQAEEAALAVAASGLDALDLALRWSVLTDDAATGARLCRAIARMASAPTPGLQDALASGDGALAGEAAVALGHIAVQAGTPASAYVVGALAEVTGREIVRIAVIVDADTERADIVRTALTGQGVLVNHRGSGASGVALLHDIPGVDVILVGDSLPDLTLDAILADVRDNVVTAETPVFLLSANAELGEMYSDHLAGTIEGPDGLGVLDDVFAESLTGDRARADELAQRAAATLAGLARARHTNIGTALDALAGTLAARPDAVTVPAMQALAAAGTADQIGALAAVVADTERSDEARVAAADALAGIFGRHVADGSQLAAVRAVATSDADLSVREAVARAMGRAQLPSEERESLLRDLRKNVREGDE